MIWCRALVLVQGQKMLQFVLQLDLFQNGGVDVVRHKKELAATIGKLQEAGIIVSLFIDPEPEQIQTAAALSVPAVELHTGAYANAAKNSLEELQLLARAATFVHQAGLILNAGHGLTYRNVTPVAELEGMEELNIGHFLISDAIFNGLKNSIIKMKKIIKESTI